MEPYLRIIQDLPRSAAFNMAADIWSLENIPRNCVQVRIYSWQQPTITLGYMQEARALLDFSACQHNRVCWIRRITGGRAVLHHDDITYSCIFPAVITFMGRTIAQSYEIISQCLLAGLAHVNIAAQSHAEPGTQPLLPGSGQRTTLPCFLSPSRREIMVEGRKFVGSAQKRTATAVLQHGSLPLSGQHCTLAQYLNLDQKERDRQELLLREKSTHLAAIAPGLAPDTLKAALAEGFKKQLNIPSVTEPWNPGELEAISALCQNHEFLSQWISSP
jgi:lipoate-protein ligase A